MACISCRSKFDKEKLSFGKQIKSSDFLEFKDQKKKNYKLSLVSCTNCSLVQIEKPINYINITPQYSWQINKEEDRHHPLVIKELTKLKIIIGSSKVLGISNYDSAFLGTLENKKYYNSKLFDLNFLNIKKNVSRQEIIQNYLNKKNANLFAKKNGKYDIIFASKILEHSQNLVNFFDFINELLNDDGYLIIDVPDCEKSLRQGNITMIWEEHISYFTKKTLVNSLAINNFCKQLLFVYDYKQENSLVGIFKKNDKSKNQKIKYEKLLPNFIKKINFFKKNIIKILSKHKNSVIFGAGHNSIIFINLFKLGRYIKYIIDDDKNKINKYSPYSKIKIVSSNVLSSDVFSICLLAMNPEIEKKIISKFKKFKGEFYSIYTDSNMFIMNKKKKDDKN